MTSASSASPRATKLVPRKRRGVLMPTVAVLAAIVVIMLILAQVWTEVLWFDQLGYLSVFTTEWLTRIILGVVSGLVMGFIVWISLWLAHRNRPIYAPTSENASVDKYREAVDPVRKFAMIAIPIIIGFFAGASLSAQWDVFQLWLNQEPFGTVDPQFGIDIAFYTFTLPWLRTVVSFLTMAVIAGGIGAIVVHYLYGGLRVATKGERVTTAARVQLSVMAAIISLLVGVGYWLDRYSLLLNNGDNFSGASYTDVHAVIPAKEILAGISVLVAILFIVVAFRGNWMLPVSGVAVMVIAALVVGWAYPAVVQTFQVEPSAQTMEADYIKRNIEATKAAYGLQDVETTNYDAKTNAEAGALREDADTTTQIRLLDPALVSPTFRQLQVNKQYYGFADALSVDRYQVDGKSQDTVIAVRELALDPNRSWVNNHIVYTHGYGVVAAYGNKVGAEGRPAFLEADIPSNGGLGEYEPRIYFGQTSPEYSIVGAPKGAPKRELDRPDDKVKSGQIENTFEGDGGPAIGGLLNKILYSIKFSSTQILFSEYVNEESQILYDRNPHDRVAKVAPYLTLDGRTYPAIVDGKVVWIVDGYTTSKGYPYAAVESLDEATEDSLTQNSKAVKALAPETANYMRNSVKATVDAYDGTVTLYAWDEADPVLKTWTKIFPSTVKPLSEISGSLMSHMRYPEDLFKVQRKLLGRYHVADPGAFYSGQDFWRSPVDPTGRGDGVDQLQPPYYLTLQMPKQDEPTFSLMSTFIPIDKGSANNQSRSILTGFLAVNAEPGNKKGVIDDDYGKLRLMSLPRNATVPGPGQVQNQFNASPTVSQSLNLLKQGSSKIVFGNQLTLPVGGGLLYVEPVYVESSTGTTYPLLQKVLVAFGDKIGYADTLTEALDQVFGGDSGALGGDAENEGTTKPEEGETPPPEEGAGSEGGTSAQNEQVKKAIVDAKAAMDASDAALKAGDWEAYGKAQAALKEAIARAIEADAASVKG